MKKNALKSLSFFTVICFSLPLLAACTSISSSSSSEAKVSSTTVGRDTQSLWSRSTLLQEVQVNIIKASPESLLEARSILLEQNRTADNIEALYVTEKLIEYLYPELIIPEGRTVKDQDVPLGSRFPAIFQDLTAQRLPEISQNDAGIVTLMLTALAPVKNTKLSHEEISVEILRQFESLNTFSVVPPLVRGVIAERRGRNRDAFEEYRKALLRDESCYPAAVGMARIYEKRNEHEFSIPLLLGIPLTLKQNAEIPRLLAAAYFKSGNMRAAEEAADASLRVSPEQGSLLYIKAWIAANRNEWESAADYLKKAEKFIPLSGEDIVLKAFVFYHLEKNAAAAVELLDDCPEISGMKPEWKEFYGKLLIEVGRRKEGSEVLLSLIRDYPERISAVKLLIPQLFAEEKYQAALQYITRLFEAEKSEDAYFWAYTAYQQTGNRQKAFEFIEQLYRMNPENEQYLFHYLQVLLELRRYQDFMRHSEQSVQTDISHTLKSRIFYLRSRIRTSPSLQLQDLQSAIFVDPLNIEALISLAEYYLERGEQRKAYLYLKQASALNPDDPAEKRKLKDLEQRLNP